MNWIVILLGGNISLFEQDLIIIENMHIYQNRQQNQANIALILVIEPAEVDRRFFVIILD